MTGKIKKYYELFSIKRAMKDKVKQISDNVYVVNNKNTVINNKKNFTCDCKFANDNKLKIKYCHCCLSVMYHIDKEMFWKELADKEYNKESLKDER